MLVTEAPAGTTKKIEYSSSSTRVHVLGHKRKGAGGGVRVRKGLKWQGTPTRKNNVKSKQIDKIESKLNSVKKNNKNMD